MANDVCRPPIEQIPSFNAIPPLNAWGFQNVVPFTFGDDISEYEMVCKLRWYVKTLIDAVNQINEDLCNIHGTINDVINKVNQIGTSLETVNNNLASLEQRLAANETAVDNLNTELGKTNTKVAENAAAIQSNLNLIQKNIADIATLVEKVTQLRTDVDNHTEQIANINAHIATIDSQISEINGHLTTIDEEINALQEKAATHDTQIGELTNRANQNDTDHAQFRSDITALQEADNQLNTKLERVAAKANDNASDITSMKQVDASHTAAIQTINDNVATINTILDNHKDRLDGLDGRVTTISNQADFNASNIANLEIEQVDQNNRIKAVEDKVKDLPPSFEDLTAQVETNKTDIGNLKTITDGHTESITEINANRANDKAEIDANTQAIQTLENSDNVMEQRMDTFETTVAAVEAKVDNIPADVGTELETITANVTSATETANTASATATEAKTEADTANTNATAATTVANEAKTKAEEAYTEAMHATGDIAELNTTVGANTSAITVIEAEQTAQNERIKALEDAGGSVPADVQEQIDAIKVVDQRQDTDISNLTTANANNHTAITNIINGNTQLPVIRTSSITVIEIGTITGESTANTPEIRNASMFAKVIYINEIPNVVGLIFRVYGTTGNVGSSTSSKTGSHTFNMSYDDNIKNAVYAYLTNILPLGSIISTGYYLQGYVNNPSSTIGDYNVVVRIYNPVGPSGPLNYYSFSAELTSNTDASTPVYSIMTL